MVNYDVLDSRVAAAPELGGDANMTWRESDKARRVRRPKTDAYVPNPVTSEIRQDMSTSSPSKKMWEKYFYNPMVALGMGGTVGALTLGLFAMMKGDQAKQQRMMRYRVGFQGLAIMSITAGLMVGMAGNGDVVPKKDVAPTRASI